MRLRFVLPAAVLVILIVLFAFGLQHDPREVPSPLIGKPAPDFTLRRVGEQTVFSRDDLLGRPVLVNFWASWCVPCRAEMPDLEALANDYNSDRFELVPINLDVGESGLEKARKFLEEEKLSLPLYPAPMQAFQKLQQQAVTVGLPTTLLLDEKGCELAVLQGPAVWDGPDGRAVIDALLDV